jgi:hypothetical protein
MRAYYTWSRIGTCRRGLESNEGLGSVPILCRTQLGGLTESAVMESAMMMEGEGYSITPRFHKTSWGGVQHSVYSVRTSRHCRRAAMANGLSLATQRIPNEVTTKFELMPEWSTETLPRS